MDMENKPMGIQSQTLTEFNQLLEKDHDLLNYVFLSLLVLILLLSC